MQAARIVTQAIRYMKYHFDDKLELDTIAAALCYSKFHLHRIFTKTIIEIALISGYESQQAFSSIFKAMYKTAPAEFRQARQFYPVQSFVLTIS
jgi:AraC-like DNA-binding protein